MTQKALTGWASFIRMSLFYQTIDGGTGSNMSLRNVTTDGIQHLGPYTLFNLNHFMILTDFTSLVQEV